MSKNKKFNIIDVLIILIIIVFVIGLGIRIFGSTSKGIKSEKDITYTVEVKNVREFTVDALKKSSVLTDEKGEKVIGEILSVDAAPYKTEAHISDGSAAVLEMPERYTCSVVIKSPAKYVNDIYNLVEGVDVAIGDSFTIINKYVKTNGTVLELSEKTAEKE